MSKAKKKFKASVQEETSSEPPVITEASRHRSQSPFIQITRPIAVAIIAVIGIVVYSFGLSGPFMGDDTLQIVDNPVVHSIGNLLLFFQGSTFYFGHGIAPLGGTYYRPLMTTAFSLLYSIFGAHTFYFHLFQLLICVGSAILLYLVFEYVFSPTLSLVLALIFLVHPLNSQVVFALPSMQDALFFFFGMLAMWTLLRSTSVRNISLAAICLCLSLLAKESGILFVFTAVLHIYWFNRKQLWRFLVIMSVPLLLYLILHINAVGFAGRSSLAPIDNEQLISRLMTAPSIMLFYLVKFIFPWKLASGYYWVNASFSISHVLIPLMIDFSVIALIAYLAVLMRHKVTTAEYHWYLLFAIWAGLGTMIYLQIFPLDMTAAETWFYFPMVGMLGVIGVVLMAFQDRLRESWFMIFAVIIIGTLGIRTILRADDWSNPYKLASNDVTVSKQDYVAYNDLASILISQGNYSEARAYAQRSVDIFPQFNNYNSLGVDLVYLGDYPGAMSAYERGMHYSSTAATAENLGGLTLLCGNPNTNRQLIIGMLQKYPEDANLWADLALLEDKYGDANDAKAAIQKAATYGQAPPYYNAIMNNQSFTLRLPTVNKDVSI